MNSIRRARRRPRKLSVNFRTLWWVIRREAFLRIWAPLPGQTESRGRREWLCSATTAFLTRTANRLLREQPSRRFYE